MSDIEVIEGDSITLQPDPDQHLAWASAAKEMSLVDWLKAVADEAAAAAALPERTWPVRIPLKYPVEHAGERISVIEMQRGKLAHIKGIRIQQPVPTDTILILASRLSGQPRDVIDSLDPDDAGEVMEIAADFFGKCLATGRTR